MKTVEIGSGGIADAAPGDWAWRLSLATIARDGPFSIFPGVDRTAVLCDGAVQLEPADATLPWSTPGELHDFPGEAAFAARLSGGPAHFFNVMVKRAPATEG